MSWRTEHAEAGTNTIRDALRTPVRTARRERAIYSHGRHRPLGSFLALIGVYGTGAGTAVLFGRRAGVRLPARPGWRDLALVALATQRSARLVAKDSVTSPLRAPFTEFDEAGGPGEVNERVRGTGGRKAVGELLACPFCVGQWIGTGFVFGLAIAPRATRWVASAFAVVTAADAAQFGYAALQLATE